MKQLRNFIILIFCVSCTNSIKHAVTEASLTTDVQLIKTELPDLDPVKIRFLNFLIFDSGTGMVQKLEANKYSYETVLDRLDSLAVLRRQYNLQKELLITQIDSTCKLRETSIEKYTKQKEDLNQLVTIKVINIVNTYWDKYGDAVQLKVKAVNHTNTPIKHLKFDLKIGNPQTSEKIIIPCEINLPIKHALDHNFIFDEKVHPKINPCLSHVKFPRCNWAYQVTSILNGQHSRKLDKQGVDSLISDNFSKPQAKNPSEYCAYINSNEIIVQKLNKIQEQEVDELNVRYPILSEYTITTK